MFKDTNAPTLKKSHFHAAGIAAVKRLVEGTFVNCFALR